MACRHSVAKPLEDFDSQIRTMKTPMLFRPFALLLIPVPGFALVGGEAGTLPAPLETPVPVARYDWSEPLEHPLDGKLRLQFFVQALELDEVEFDPDDAPTADLRDIDRTRSGFRAAWGKAEARAYAQVFGETWDQGFQTDKDFPFFGIGGGVYGEPAVATFEGGDVKIVIPYRAGVNLAAGSDERGSVEEEAAYAEFEGEVAVGVDLWGFRPAVGAYVTSLTGEIEVDDGINNPDVDFSGSNAGGFVELQYSHPDYPFFGKIRGLGGDVEGGMFTFGVTF